LAVSTSRPSIINDYSVCTTWLVKGKDYYLIDVLRAKLNYPDLKHAIIDRALSFNASSIIIEDEGSGTSLIY
jgi:phage terminase large subunit-like protein